MDWWSNLDMINNTNENNINEINEKEMTIKKEIISLIACKKMYELQILHYERILEINKDILPSHNIILKNIDIVDKSIGIAIDNFIIEEQILNKIEKSKQIINNITKIIIKNVL